MSKKKTAILHIGIHKTGSTSIQRFLGVNRSKLRQCGIDFYSGIHHLNNHVELHTAAIRTSRETPFKLTSGVLVNDDYRNLVRDRVREYVSNSECESVLFSAEGLSYLRYDDELERLTSMIPAEDIRVIMYLRNPDSFMKSYKLELKKNNIKFSEDKESVAYVLDDTWLTNYGERVSFFRNWFGDSNTFVLDFDDEVRQSRSVIPSFLTSLGLKSEFCPQDWENLFLNQGPPPSKSRWFTRRSKKLRNFR